MTKVWGELSNDAQNILEWVEDVVGGKHNVLQLEVGVVPFRSGKTIPEFNHNVTEEVFGEVVEYAETRDDLTVIVEDGVARIGFDHMFELQPGVAPGGV